MDIRRFGAQYRSRDVHAARASSRCTRPTTTSTTRTRSARRAGRCAVSPAYPRLVELGCEFGEKSGWERPNWFEPNAADRRADAGARGARPRGWAGEHWSAAIGAEALACRDAAALFDETQLLEDRGLGPRRGSRSSSGCAPTRSTGRSAPSPTRSCCNERAASSATSPSRGSAPDAVPARHRHRVRQPRSRLDPQALALQPPAPCTWSRRHSACACLRRVGTAGARRSARATDRRLSATTRSRT